MIWGTFGKIVNTVPEIAKNFNVYFANIALCLEDVLNVLWDLIPKKMKLLLGV